MSTGLKPYLLLSFFLHLLLGLTLALRLATVDWQKLQGHGSGLQIVMLSGAPYLGVPGNAAPKSASQNLLHPARLVKKSKGMATQSESLTTITPVGENSANDHAAAAKSSIAGNGAAATAGVAAGQLELAGLGNGAGFGAGGNFENPSYRLIRQKIENAKLYPQFAIKRGIEGTVRVRFKLDEQGHPVDTDIIQSSGSSILDQATLATINRAAPYPVVAGWISFPLVYDLQRP